MNLTENSTLVDLEDFEVFDTRDMINVIAYSLMSTGNVWLARVWTNITSSRDRPEQSGPAGSGQAGREEPVQEEDQRPLLGGSREEIMITDTNNRLDQSIVMLGIPLDSGGYHYVIHNFPHGDSVEIYSSGLPSPTHRELDTDTIHVSGTGATSSARSSWWSGQAATSSPPSCWWSSVLTGNHKNWDSLETNPAIHFDWVVWVDWVFTLISVIRSREKIKNIIWRYISIKSPLVSLNWSSQRKRARRMVITAWILTILFSSPQAVIFRSTTLFIFKIPNFNQNLQNLCK